MFEFFHRGRITIKKNTTTITTTSKVFVPVREFETENIGSENLFNNRFNNNILALYQGV